MKRIDQAQAKLPESFVLVSIKVPVIQSYTSEVENE